MPKSVLVVDDAVSIRFLIRANLELEGFTVNEAVDGEDCLEQLSVMAEPPAAITMDVMMPRRGGVSTVSAIRADPRYAGTAIVMVSTQGHPLDIQRALQVGADAYLTKPFDPDVLVATVREAVAEMARPRIDR